MATKKYYVEYTKDGWKKNAWYVQELREDLTVEDLRIALERMGYKLVIASEL